MAPTFNHATRQIGTPLTVAVNFQNTGNQTANYLVGVSIGKQGQKWYDTSIYTDGFGSYRTSATIAPGANTTVSRVMTVPSDQQVSDDPSHSTAPIAGDWDCWVTLKDAALNIVDQFVAVGCLTVTPVPVISAQILSITLS